MNQETEKIQTLKSLRIVDCFELSIEYFKQSDHIAPDKKITLQSSETIESLIQLFETLPENGGFCISFVPQTPRISLVFRCHHHQQYVIDLYGNKIQTPKHGTFYLDDLPAEKQIVQIVNDLIDKS